MQFMSEVLPNQVQCAVEFVCKPKRTEHEHGHAVPYQHRRDAKAEQIFQHRGGRCSSIILVTWTARLRFQTSRSSKKVARGTVLSSPASALWSDCMAGTRSVVFLDAGLAMLFVANVVLLLWALNRCCRAQASSRVVGERAEEEGGGGLSAEQVGELPCHECKEGPGAGECAVCLEAFRAGDRRRVLPGCEHGFHAECVDSWLRKSRRCPICRGEVVVVAAHGKNAGEVAEATAVEIVTER
ncbi:hypothetical protein GQ55_1G385300 [Panicum hallii var. hallii]|uniref:RING-type domain-containing protein n=1 Tax=Panicum hallii var. hallii TaxID=1504633 RepID=A0A2T7FBY3_9POAL|nr:hypothetical protein GQ55_1G385300 [Panicum hallii var. hallii]